jgi:diguanylate cyclase (GGDEF)-like protein
VNRRAHLVFATVATSLVFGFLGLQLWREHVVASGRIGVGIQVTEDGVEVTDVRHGGPADIAGVRVDDRITAIDHRPTMTLEDLRQASVAFHRGLPVHVELLRGDNHLDVETVPGLPFPWWRTGLTAIACLGYLALGLLAFGQAPNDERTRVLWLFSAAVALELALPQTLPSIPKWSLIADAAYFLLTGIQIGLELHLASVIPRRTEWFKRSRMLPALYYVLGLGTGIVAATTSVLEGLNIQFLPWTSAAVHEVMSGWGLNLWSLAVVAILVNQLLSADTRGLRTQAAMVLAGVAPWWVFQLTSAVVTRGGDVLPVWMTRIEPLALLAWPVAVFIAIFKYHLLDVRFVVQRSLVFILVTAALASGFFAVFAIGSVVFAPEMSSGGFPATALSLAMLSLGLLFAPVRRVIQTQVDRRLFPERLEMARRLTELTAELPTRGSLPSMGRHLVNRTVEIFGLASATLLVADPETGVLVTLASSTSTMDARFGQSFLIEPNDPGVEFLRRIGEPVPADRVASSSASLAQRLHAFNTELAVGLVTGPTLAGLLLIGPKDNGERFGSAESELLGLFAHAAATVFENARLFESATYEGLTGLLRREAILANLEREMARAVRYRRPLSIGMVDIDFFKRVNDSYGHLTGDAFLQQVAARLKAGLRTTDSIGRYGGEEFLFILPETEIEGAGAVAEKLRIGVESMEIETGPGSLTSVTVSIGLAEIDHDGPAPGSVTRLIGAADDRLLNAKRQGRNRVVPGPVAAA